MENLRRFVKFLYDNKEILAANIITLITSIALLFGLAKCVAGDSVVKEITSCINNVCTVKGAANVLDEVKNNINQ